MLEIRQRQAGDVTILDLSGRIRLGEEEQSFRQKLNQTLEQGAKKILLNMADVDYVDSAGVGSLVYSYSTAVRRGAEVKLLNLTNKLQDLLAVTKLLTVFDSFQDEQTAIRSFASD